MPRLHHALLLCAAGAACLLWLDRERPAPPRRAAARQAKEAPPALPDPGSEALPDDDSPDSTGEVPSCETVRDLLRLLDTDVRRKDRIVRRIAEIGGDEAWEGLVARLYDPSLRKAIEISLGRFAPREVIDGLKHAMLRAPDAATRASIVRILAATADPAHGPDVRGLLQRETDPEVRHAAIGALGRFGDTESADALLALARPGGTEARTARFALQRIASMETLEVVAARRHELGPEARLSLLHAASSVEEPADGLVATATEALLDPDARLRLAAVRLLSRAGEEAVEPLLDHALRRVSVSETERTLAALAEFATPRAAEAGLRALEALPPSRQERYRASFLATLGR